MENLKQLYLYPLIVTGLCSYLTKRKQSVVINGVSNHSSVPVSFTGMLLLLEELLHSNPKACALGVQFHLIH